jgi:DNA helicase-2/ATP-dependent DNA helicase PcrA
MRHRIQAMLGGGASPYWLGTFHGLGARQLRHEPEVAGLRHGFDILDGEDSMRLVKRSMAALGLDPRPGAGEGAMSPKSLCKAIGRMKDTLVTPEEAAAHVEVQVAEGARTGMPVDPAGARMAAQVYVEYQRRLQEANLADFGDLLLYPTIAMQRDEAYRRRWAGRFDAIFCDEYQDVNQGQYAWLMLLCQDHRRIFAVGDDDQCIFSFRGSDVRFIRSFTRDVPDAIQVRLEENFRSTGHILAAANAVIAGDTKRLGKTLFTSKGMGERIEVVGFRGPEEEAAGIASEMVRRHAGGVPWGSMALLFRGNALARGYEDALLRAQVPYQLLGDTGFYQRAEVKDALALLRLATHPEDRQSDDAFRRVANVPARGLSAKVVEAIEAEAGAKGCSLLIAARTANLHPKAREAALLFVDVVLDASADFTLSLADQLSVLLDRTGYRAMLRDSRADGVEGRLENLQELLRLAGTFHNAEALLEHGALSGQGAEREDAGDGQVKLMTLHKGKGLEFDHVFLPAWESGLFPADYSDMGEERRLAYVALTRGRLRVTVSYCAFRRGSTKVSCFVEDLPAENVVHGWLHSQQDGGAAPGGTAKGRKRQPRR